MVVLIVGIVVAVLALLVLAVLVYQLLGAFGRLTREVGGLQADLEPVLADVRTTLAHAAQQRAARDTPAPMPPVLGAGDTQVTGG